MADGQAPSRETPETREARPPGDPVAALSARLCLSLPDYATALAALTHKSYVNEHRAEEGLTDNERLEFLGDAVARAAAGTLDRDYKTQLQEVAQSRLRATPRYRVIAEHGPDHSKIFEVESDLKGEVVGRGTGRSKKDAEQAAAKLALDALARRFAPPEVPAPACPEAAAPEEPAAEPIPEPAEAPAQAAPRRRTKRARPSAKRPPRRAAAREGKGAPARKGRSPKR